MVVRGLAGLRSIGEEGEDGSSPIPKYASLLRIVRSPQAGVPPCRGHELWTLPAECQLLSCACGERVPVDPGLGRPPDRSTLGESRLEHEFERTDVGVPLRNTMGDQLPELLPKDVRGREGLPTSDGDKVDDPFAGGNDQGKQLGTLLDVEGKETGGPTPSEAAPNNAASTLA